jgi:carbonic anhydrase
MGTVVTPNADATQETDVGVIDDLLANNERYAAGHGQGHIPIRPAKRLVVVACMDSRLDLFAALGLELGDAQVLRNAGGVITDDVLRSLAISQRLLGTEEIVLIHHTDCGMQKITDDDLLTQIAEETGARPSFAIEAFSDVDASVRQSIARVRNSPFVPHKDSVRGFVYDVDTGRLREVH